MKVNKILSVRERLNQIPYDIRLKMEYFVKWAVLNPCNTKEQRALYRAIKKVMWKSSIRNKKD